MKVRRKKTSIPERTARLLDRVATVAREHREDRDVNRCVGAMPGGRRCYFDLEAIAAHQAALRSPP